MYPAVNAVYYKVMKPVHTPLIEIGNEFKEVTKHINEAAFCWLEANTTAKKVAILVHGVTGNKLDMVVLGREYVKLGYAVYAPDLPGHGKAPELAASTFDELGDWLDECIMAIGRVPDVLVGNSFASGICYNFAAQGYLDEKTHLILTCPTPDIAWSSRALRRAGGIFPHGFTTRAYNSRIAIKTRVLYLSKSRDESSKKWLNESEYHKIPFIDARIGHQMSILLDTHNPYLAPPLRPDVQKRITVVLGTKDNVVTKRSLPLLRRLLPGARIIMIPGAGHILHFEAPREIAISGVE